MFSHALKQTLLTDEIDSEYFSNINACLYEGDNSFCATLRMLLFDRLKADEKVDVELTVIKREHIEVKLHPEDAGSIKYENVFHSQRTGANFEIRVLDGCNTEDLDSIMRKASRYIGNFKYQLNVSIYLAQAGHKTAVYVSEESKEVIVFTLGMSLKYWHYMQSALPKLLPWYFDTPVKEFEKKLLHSLTLKNSKSYLELITSYVNQYDFREEKLKRSLKNFGVQWEGDRLETLKTERTRVAYEFTQLQEQISRIIERDRELQASILGLELSVGQGDKTGLTDYFICNKSLHLCEVNKDKLKYIVTTCIEYYDQSIFDKYFENPSSYFHSNPNPINFTYDGYKALVLAIFGDEISIKVRVCAEFELALAGTLLPCQASDHITSYNGWLGHPHINDHACLGSNAMYINQLMNGKKYIEAIEQSVAAVKNINFSDTTVAKKFINPLCSSREQFLMLSDGRVVSPKEAVAWLMKDRGNT